MRAHLAQPSFTESIIRLFEPYCDDVTYSFKIQQHLLLWFRHLGIAIIQTPAKKSQALSVGWLGNRRMDLIILYRKDKNSYLLSHHQPFAFPTNFFSNHLSRPRTREMLKNTFHDQHEFSGIHFWFDRNIFKIRLLSMIMLFLSINDFQYLLNLIPKVKEVGRWFKVGGYPVPQQVNNLSAFISNNFV